MSIPAIPPIGSTGFPTRTQGLDRPDATPGFGDAIAKGIEQVSALENRADALTQQVATGGDVSVHELMVATTEASIGVELLSQVRNKAVEAYQEIMRLQV